MSELDELKNKALRIIQEERGNRVKAFNEGKEFAQKKYIEWFEQALVNNKGALIYEGRFQTDVKLPNGGYFDDFCLGVSAGLGELSDKDSQFRYSIHQLKNAFVDEGVAPFSEPKAMYTVRFTVQAKNLPQLELKCL